MNAGMPVRLFLELTGFGLPLHYSECPKSGSVPGTPLKPLTHTHTNTHPYTHTHAQSLGQECTEKLPNIHFLH